MSAQRRRRLADVVQMLYKCFVFAGDVRLPEPPGGCNSLTYILPTGMSALMKLWYNAG